MLPSIANRKHVRALKDTEIQPGCWTINHRELIGVMTRSFLRIPSLR